MANSTPASPLDAKSNPQLDNEQRYMALLALTSQELPVQPDDNRQWAEQDLGRLSQAEWDLLYRQLDTDPAQLEGFLLRERPSVSKATPFAPKRVNATRHIGWQDLRKSVGDFVEWIAGPRARYVAAFSVAVVAGLVVLQQLPQPSLNTRIEQSFVGVEFSAVSASVLVLPWEHAAAGLGFSAASSNDSQRAREFASGLLRAKRKLLLAPGAISPTSTRQVDSDSSYVALGEWNVLLWAACASVPSPARHFWSEQQALAHELAAGDFADVDRVAIAKHFANTAELLAALAGGENEKRIARRLSDELTRFREEMAPTDPKAVNAILVPDAR